MRTLTFLAELLIQRAVFKPVNQRASPTPAVPEWIGMMELKPVRNVG